MSRVRVNIDLGVLKGFDPADRTALVEGLQHELAQVLAEPAAQVEWARSHRTSVLRLGSMPWEPSPRGSRKFGGGIARAIRKGLKP